LPVDIIMQVLPESHPRAAMQTDRLSDVAGIKRDAAANTFLEKPITKEQRAAFYPVPNPGK
jgi:hypothetical protein